MIELPGWNDHISVNGFCYSSSMGESPKLSIPLKTSPAPTKGIAPNIFTRNSTATYIKDGLVKTAGIDVIKFQNGRYLCEPAATNLIKNSQNLSLWENSWAGGVTVTSGIYTIAGLPAFRLTQIDNVGDAIYGGDGAVISLTAGTKYYASFFIKNFTAIRSSVAFWDTVKATMNTLVILWTSGVPSTYSNPTTITEIVYTALADEGEYLVSFAYTVPVGSSSHRFMFFPEVGAVATNGIIVTGVQLATIITSYIPTTTVPMGRVADVLHYAVGDVITQGHGSLYCEFVGTTFSGVIKRFLHLSDATNYNRIYMQISASTNIFAAQAVTNNVLEGNIAGGTPIVGLNKVLITYINNSVSFYANGALIGSDTSCAIATNLSKLNIGSTHDNLYHLNSEIGNIKYFKEVLTPAQAIKLTTL